MIVNKLKTENFRNLEGGELEFSPKVNIICGENAQGKTNLIESIWMMTGCKSFRGSAERSLFAEGKNRIEINMGFYSGKRKMRADYVIMRTGEEKKKKIVLNKVPVQSAKELFDAFKCICFTPDDIDLVAGAPERRRSFVDLCVSQLYASAMMTLKRFNGVMYQRKAVLKNIREGLQKESDLEIWDRQAAALGTQMSAYRSDYVKKLAEKAGAVYSEITGGREELSIKYSSNVFGKEVPGLKSLKDEKYIKEYYKKLLASRADDIRSGHTRYGANRDEIVIKTEGRKTREFGSQGQKKSTALALKLASARIYSEKSREAPVILLDDVMGELDEKRQRYVYNMIRDMQIFITTCQTASLEKSIYSDPGVKIFKVEKGRIIS